MHWHAIFLPLHADQPGTGIWRGGTFILSQPTCWLRTDSLHMGRSPMSAGLEQAEADVPLQGRLRLPACSLVTYA